MRANDSFTLPRTGIILKNRTVLAAMTNKQSHENGVLSEEEKKWLIRRARGDFAITTTAATHVTETGRGWHGEMGVWGDHHIPGLTDLANGLRQSGTVSLAQLFHGGMRAPKSINGVQPISASVNTEPGMDGIYTRALEDNEIKEMINSFADAAVRCEKAGFDGVELHGAHSYLICQFLGKITNRRDDEWGGDLEGRSRFLREIIKLIRERTDPNFLIAVRISPIIEKAGIYLDDSLELAKILSKLEIDILHISCWDVFQEIESDSKNKSLTKLFKDVIPESLPLISTGAVWTAKDAKYVFDEGADLVGVARVGIAHPDWPKYISDISYTPQKPPFSEAHLLEMDLSPAFVDYMRAWKGFVVGGK